MHNRYYTTKLAGPARASFLLLLFLLAAAGPLGAQATEVLSYDFEDGDLSAFVEPEDGVTTISVVADPEDPDNNVFLRDGAAFNSVRLPFDALPEDVATITAGFRWRTQSVTDGWGDFFFLGNGPNRLRWQKHADDTNVRINSDSGPAEFFTGLEAETWYDVGLSVDVATKTMTWTMDDQSIELGTSVDLSNISNLFLGGSATNNYWIDDLTLSYETGDGGGSAFLTAPFTETFEGPDPLALWQDGGNMGSVDNDLAVVPDPTDPLNQVLRRDGGSFGAVIFPFTAIPDEADTVVLSFRYYAESVSTGWGDYVLLGGGPNRVRFQSHADDGVFRVDDNNGNQVFLPGFAAMTWYDVSAAVAIADSTVTWTLRDTSFTLPIAAGLAGVSTIELSGNDTNVFYLDNISVRWSEAEDNPGPALLTPPFTETFEGADPLANWEDANGSVANDISIVPDPEDPLNMVMFRDGSGFNNVRFPFQPIPAGTEFVTLEFRYRTESVTAGWSDFVFLGDGPNRVRFQSHADDGAIKINSDGQEPGDFFRGIEANTWYDVHIEVDVNNGVLNFTMNDTTKTQETLVDLTGIQSLFIGGSPTNNFWLDNISVTPGRTGRPVSTDEAFAHRIGLRLYPNPTGGPLTIEANLSGYANPALELYSALGSRLFRGALGARRTTLQLGELPPGLYLYRILDGQRPLTAGRLLRQ